MRLAAPARFCALLSFCILFTLGGITAFGQWTKIQLGGSDFNPGTALFVDGSTIYVGSTGMVFRSTDGGTSFDKLNNGIGDALSGCTDIVKIGNRVYAAFGGNGGRGVYYSEDQGDTWIADTAGWQAIANVPVKPYARRLHAFNDTHLFAILETNYTLYKKPEDAEWSAFPIPGDYRTPSDIFFDGDTIFVCQVSTTVPKSAYTTNLGMTWEYRVGTGKEPLNRIWKNHSGKELYASIADFAKWGQEWLIRSTDNGMSWDTITPRNTTAVTSVYADGDIVLASFGGSFTAADSTNKIILSTDRGDTWTDISADYRSTLAFGFHSPVSLALYGNTVFAGIGLSTGVIKRTIDIEPTSVQGPSPSVREHHIFPNPANDILYVKELVAGNQYEVVDVHGTSVVRGFVTGDAVDLTELPAGAYVLVLRSDGDVRHVRFLKN